MTTDSVFAIFSTTKAITGTAALQLVEEGRLDLDAPAKKYAPEIGKLQVLEGFDADGKPRLRAPKRDVTTRMLLLHTAGFGYDFFNEQYNRLAQEHGQPSVITASKASLRTPLLFDPGDEWEYGSNIDWAGQVVEGITGKRLGEVMQERIFAPLGMASTAFTLTPTMRSPPRPHPPARGRRLARRPCPISSCRRSPRSTWAGTASTPRSATIAASSACGSTTAPASMAACSSPRPCAWPSRTASATRRSSSCPGSSQLSNDAEFFPGMPKSWALTFMINDEQAPTGRPAGSLGWAGLANLFYWIDRRNGIGGFWATQVFPFADPTSFGGYMDFETAVYDSLAAEGGMTGPPSDTQKPSGSPGGLKGQLYRLVQRASSTFRFSAELLPFLPRTSS